MRTVRHSAAAPTVAQPAAQRSVTLPKTATDAELRLWFGLLLCLASLLLLFVRRRRLFAQ
jgi:LPXTG-motif cell wall-anchored protein